MQSDDRDHADHQTKKEKHWFEEVFINPFRCIINSFFFQKSEQNGENRRSSIFKGFLKKVKSSTTLKSTNKSASSSKMDTIANETHLSITSESSITSVESCHSAQFPNVAKNAMLRTLVNRDSFTPVPPPDGESVTFILPEIGSSKLEFTSKMDDAISVREKHSKIHFANIYFRLNLECLLDLATLSMKTLLPLDPPLFFVLQVAIH